MVLCNFLNQVHYLKQCLNLIAAVNYVAVSEYFGVSPSVLAAGLAADNVICAVYFTSLFALASKIPAEAAFSTNGMLFYTHFHDLLSFSLHNFETGLVIIGLLNKPLTFTVFEI